MSVKLGVGLGPLPPGDRSPDRFWRWIDVCEREGIDSVWLSDRIVGRGNTLEPMTAFAAIAGRTQRMKFGPSVLVLPLRHPVVLAKAIATLDFLSNGRLLLAVGVGVDDEKEWRACGVPKSERGARLDEAVALLRRLWTEPVVTFHGQFFHCEDVTITPKPVQAALPIWIGGHTDAALRRTARLGDGWLPSFVTPEEFAAGKAALATLLADYGRQIDDDHYGTFVLYALGTSRAEAWEKAAPHVIRPASRRDATPDHPYYALGTPDDVIRTVRRYLDAGASKFVMRPVCAPDEVEDQLRWL
ncbi:MAG: LLM class flavin-dependent oxidoreductase, partial [Dehalococcoidia bacterium]|nr:LLM class flavin-dependent oxidoreductase [Dehalococcoidia bacterium]